MGCPIRMYAESGIYFVTARTIQSRLLLRPTKVLNEVIGGILARACRTNGVELFGYVFASNHFHLLVRAPGSALSPFMQFLMSNIARKAAFLSEWTGPFWARRFSAEPVLDDESMENRLDYILAHGVKEGLVRRSEDWPGLSCLSHLLGTLERAFRWFNWTLRWKNRSPAGTPEAGRFDSRWAEAESLTLQPLPHWSSLTGDQLRRRIRTMIDSTAAKHLETRTSVLGLEAIAAQHPHSVPRETKKSNRPLCHAASVDRWRAFRALRLEFVSAFRHASRLWRAGQRDVSFPAYSYCPGGFLISALSDQRFATAA